MYAHEKEEENKAGTCWSAGIRTGRIFSVLHNSQQTFFGETSLIFGLRGFSPSIR